MTNTGTEEACYAVPAAGTVTKSSDYVTVIGLHRLTHESFDV